MNFIKKIFKKLLNKKEKKNLDAEDKIIIRLTNRWQFLAYVLEYHKWKLVIIFIILITILILIKYIGIDFMSLFKLIFKVFS
jgi:hypothetical protein